MEQSIEKIIKKQTHCYFISPHLDDAVLSAGGLLSYLSGKTPVTLVNIFTEATEKPYTMAAKGFLRDCGITDAKELFQLRREEEKNVAMALDVISINLGFIDGSFRTRRKTNKVLTTLGKKFPEINHLYPLGRKIIALAKDDKILAEEITQRLQKITRNETNFIVFCPIGTVRHMDHVITRDVCLKTFSNIIFWVDFPYSNKAKIKNYLQGTELEQLYWSKNMKDKQILIKFYKSQIESLLTMGSLEQKYETYYTYSSAGK